jgi:cell division protease FtsH
MLSEHHTTLERIALELRRHETLDAKQLGQILVETGVSLAEVAPIAGAETLPDAAASPATGPATANHGGEDAGGTFAPGLPGGGGMDLPQS